ncbi:ABC transporter ATP-binding protein [uncultured Methanobrevibacter sp.]|uniref:ABC transporter ATP-binding protein n=1 Tax=uncultured Methanobrevibacter sp. TaxID=253161 RepID=UPI0025E39B5D|nr:ATP-binding cassette domain-containing protein [uncultured Methanobrevibacter sp.]MBE6503047.1 ATP-binding cassette domain-containing protein [Methanobrevibacter sp.]
MNLKADNISFSYNNNKQILKDVSLSINSNEVIGLMGDSGSGKSTLCKIISDHISKYSGEITIDGEKISNKGFYPIQLIFQHPEKTMNPKWKMEKVLNESWKPSSDLKNTFGIKDNWLNRWPNELSGGELQRFSILRALNPKTKFIIADEISTMLDAVTQVQIWKSLINYCKVNNIGILAVSHDEDLLEVICDDIVYFDEINNI